MKRSLVAEIVAFLLILLFVYAAISKFWDYERFVFQMKLSPLPVMKKTAVTLGWLVPCTEVLVSSLLSTAIFYPRLMKPSLLVSLCLMLSFEIYIVLMLFSGYSLPCTCGGIISQLSWKQHVVFNASIIFIIVGGLWSISEKSILKKNTKDFSRV